MFHQLTDIGLFLERVVAALLEVLLGLSVYFESVSCWDPLGSVNKLLHITGSFLLVADPSDVNIDVIHPQQR